MIYGSEINEMPLLQQGRAAYHSSSLPPMRGPGTMLTAAVITQEWWRVSP